MPIIQTPILLIIFNRPDKVEITLNEIKKVKPQHLFVAADGPRENISNDYENCKAARELIDREIDWDCEVHKLFHEKNLGCDEAVYQAITWFFNHVESGIILEDDCVPDPSFFFFCQEMLNHYKNDTRIMHVCGVNFQNGKKRGDASYYFSRLPENWGAWASWKRAWEFYDREMKTYSEFKKTGQINNIFDNPLVKLEWMYFFERLYTKKQTGWDWQWAYSVFCQNGLAISPNVNLVSNIGFGKGATHTADENFDLANMKKFSLEEIIHPEFLIPDKKADELTMRRHYAMGYLGLFYLTKRRFKRLVNKLFNL